MKTRIISGAVMVVIVAAVLFAGQYYPIVIAAFLGLLNAVAAYEITHSAAGINDKVSVGGACLYSLLMIFSLDGYLWKPAYLTVLYVLFAAVMTLVRHRDFTLARIATLAGMPLLISYAAGCLCGVIKHENGLYYLLLLLNFSSVCDVGAYFVGSTWGRHKLCPEISPKKTIEGAIGGIAFSLIVTVALAFLFNRVRVLPLTLLLTIPFCITGMVGDLFASAIKRTAGIKDYGNLIPGHGGILDRGDSILMIAPLLYMFMLTGAI